MSNTVIELVALIVTLIGGGTVSISKLTRIAVGVENLTEALKTTNTQVAAHALTLTDHEHRLDKGGL